MGFLLIGVGFGVMGLDSVWFGGGVVVFDGIGCGLVYLCWKCGLNCGLFIGGFDFVILVCLRLGYEVNYVC